jgi:hypothetical protein
VHKTALVARLVVRDRVRGRRTLRDGDVSAGGERREHEEQR